MLPMRCPVLPCKKVAVSQVTGRSSASFSKFCAHLRVKGAGIRASYWVRAAFQSVYCGSSGGTKRGLFSRC